MADIVPLAPAGALTNFDPKTVERELDGLHGAATYFARRRYDDQLGQAVDEIIEYQRLFVQWWDATVRHRGNQPKNALTRSLDAVEQETGISQQTVSKWRTRLAKEDYKEQLISSFKRLKQIAALIAGEASENGRSRGTNENEWYTPLEYVDAAREVLGAIDLDPATSEQAQRNIQATNIFTKEDNALEHEWHGRVWLNPPYERGQIDAFVDKLICELGAGHVTAAVLLTHNCTETEWFQKAAGVANAICLKRKRIEFIDKNGKVGEAPAQGQVFCYFGPNIEAFDTEFSKHGLVYIPYQRG